MTTLGSSYYILMTYTTTYVPSRAVPPAIAPYADPLNFCSPRIAGPLGWLMR